MKKLILTFLLILPFLTIHSRDIINVPEDYTNIPVADSFVETSKSEPFNVNNSNSKKLINKIILKNGFLLAEIIVQRWEEQGWLTVVRYKYSYDENNNMIEELFQGGGMVKYSYTFDESNNKTEKIEYYWVNGRWVPGVKYNYTYYDNRIINERWYSWYDSIWVNHSNYLYIYDDNNNMIEKLVQYWKNSTWNNSAKWIYTYDENNNMIEQIDQYWEDLKLFNGWKTNYSYDNKNNLVEEIQQNWGDSSWVNARGKVFNYDENGNLLEQIRMIWENSTWNYQNKWIYTYDENNNMTEKLYQDPIGLNCQLCWGSSKFIYSYDENDNMIEELGQLWNWNDSVWSNYTRITYSYISITGINTGRSINLTFQLLNNYPNPFNPSTTIKYSIPKQSYVALKVYDILGNEIETLVNEDKSPGNYEVVFNASNLSSGVYFYRIHAGDFVQTKKMILLR